MPLSSAPSSLFPISSILVESESRQRKKKADPAALERSISKRGLIHPILIERETSRLIAGETRLLACRNLGWEEIPVRFAEDLSEGERRIIELEENIKRTDLSWQDQASAIAEIHALYVTEDPEWTQAKTAAACNLSDGHVSDCLRVVRAFGEEHVRGAATFPEARNFLARKEARAQTGALEVIFGKAASATTPAPVLVTQDGGLLPAPPRPKARLIIPAEESILAESFNSWAPAFSGEKFNFLHCDFPYGGEEFSGPRMTSTAFKDGGGYVSSQLVFEELLETLFASLDVLLTRSAHLLFWYTADLEKIAALVALFARRAPSFRFSKFPLIWLKSDNAGIASDASRSLRHIYEVCLFASRGDRLLVHTVADAYTGPTDRTIHPSCKPEPVLKHFFRSLVDESTRLLDPTCGSGTSLRAAEFTGAQLVLGLESNLEMTEAARGELARFRKKRLAEKLLKEKEEGDL